MSLLFCVWADQEEEEDDAEEEPVVEKEEIEESVREDKNKCSESLVSEGEAKFVDAGQKVSNKNPSSKSNYTSESSRSTRPPTPLPSTSPTQSPKRPLIGPKSVIQRLRQQEQKEQQLPLSRLVNEAEEESVTRVENDDKKEGELEAINEDRPKFFSFKAQNNDSHNPTTYRSSNASVNTLPVQLSDIELRSDLDQNTEPAKRKLKKVQDQVATEGTTAVLAQPPTDKLPPTQSRSSRKQRAENAKSTKPTGNEVDWEVDSVNIVLRKGCMENSNKSVDAAQVEDKMKPNEIKDCGKGRKRKADETSVTETADSPPNEVNSSQEKQQSCNDTEGRKTRGRMSEVKSSEQVVTYSTISSAASSTNTNKHTSNEKDGRKIRRLTSDELSEQKPTAIVPVTDAKKQAKAAESQVENFAFKGRQKMDAKKQEEQPKKQKPNPKKADNTKRKLNPDKTEESLEREEPELPQKRLKQPLPLANCSKQMFAVKKKFLAEGKKNLGKGKREKLKPCGKGERGKLKPDKQKQAQPMRALRGNSVPIDLSPLQQPAKKNKKPSKKAFDIVITKCAQKINLVPTKKESEISTLFKLNVPPTVGRQSLKRKARPHTFSHIYNTNPDSPYLYASERRKEPGVSVETDVDDEPETGLATDAPPPPPDENQVHDRVDVGHQEVQGIHYQTDELGAEASKSSNHITEPQDDMIEEEFSPAGNIKQEMEIETRSLRQLAKQSGEGVTSVTEGESFEISLGSVYSLAEINASGGIDCVNTVDTVIPDEPAPIKQETDHSMSWNSCIFIDFGSQTTAADAEELDPLADPLEIKPSPVLPTFNWPRLDPLFHTKVEFKLPREYEEIIRTMAKPTAEILPFLKVASPSSPAAESMDTDEVVCIKEEPAKLISLMQNNRISLTPIKAKHPASSLGDSASVSPATPSLRDSDSSDGVRRSSRQKKSKYVLKSLLNDSPPEEEKMLDRRIGLSQTLTKSSPPIPSAANDRSNNATHSLLSRISSGLTITQYKVAAEPKNASDAIHLKPNDNVCKEEKLKSLQLNSVPWLPVNWQATMTRTKRPDGRTDCRLLFTSPDGKVFYTRQAVLNHLRRHRRGKSFATAGMSTINDQTSPSEKAKSSISLLHKNNKAIEELRTPGPSSSPQEQQADDYDQSSTLRRSTRGSEKPTPPDGALPQLQLEKGRIRGVPTRPPSWGSHPRGMVPSRRNLPTRGGVSMHGSVPTRSNVTTRGNVPAAARGSLSVRKGVPTRGNVRARGARGIVPTRGSVPSRGSLSTRGDTLKLGNVTTRCVSSAGSDTSSNASESTNKDQEQLPQEKYEIVCKPGTFTCPLCYSLFYLNQPYGRHVKNRECKVVENPVSSMVPLAKAPWMLHDEEEEDDELEVIQETIRKPPLHYIKLVRSSVHEDSYVNSFRVAPLRLLARGIVPDGGLSTQPVTVKEGLEYYHSLVWKENHENTFFQQLTCLSKLTLAANVKAYERLCKEPLKVALYLERKITLFRDNRGADHPRTKAWVVKYNRFLKLRLHDLFLSLVVEKFKVIEYCDTAGGQVQVLCLNCPRLICAGCISGGGGAGVTSAKPETTAANKKLLIPIRIRPIKHNKVGNNIKSKPSKDDDDGDKTWTPSLERSLVSKGVSSNGGGGSARDSRCGGCEQCRRPNCEKCANCADMLKYGGPGLIKQACIFRKCSRRNVDKEAKPLPALPANKRPPTETVNSITTAPQKPSTSAVAPSGSATVNQTSKPGPSLNSAVTAFAAVSMQGRDFASGIKQDSRPPSTSRWARDNIGGEMNGKPHQVKKFKEEPKPPKPNNLPSNLLTIGHSKPAKQMFAVGAAAGSSGTNYPCSVCHKGFSTRIEMIAHRSEVHSKSNIKAAVGNRMRVTTNPVSRKTGQPSAAASTQSDGQRPPKTCRSKSPRAATAAATSTTAADEDEIFQQQLRDAINQSRLESGIEIEKKVFVEAVEDL